jgi:hypothetical protein
VITNLTPGEKLEDKGLKRFAWCEEHETRPEGIPPTFEPHVVKRVVTVESFGPIIGSFQAARRAAGYEIPGCLEQPN